MRKYIAVCSFRSEVRFVLKGGNGLGGEQEHLPGLVHVVAVPDGDEGDGLGGGGRGQVKETREVVDARRGEENVEALSVFPQNVQNFEPTSLESEEEEDEGEPRHIGPGLALHAAHEVRLGGDVALHILYVN